MTQLEHCSPMQLKQLIITQFDIKTAFHYRELKEKVYFNAPEVLEILKGKALRLDKRRYRLKQSTSKLCLNLHFNRDFGGDMGEVEIQEDSFSSDEDFDEENSESSTDVDEKIKNEEIFDRDFLKCYSALKRNDDKIYNKDVRFFDEKLAESEDTDDQSKDLVNFNKKMTRPKMTILDHQLRLNVDDVIGEVDKPHLDLQDESISDKSKPLLSHYERELDELKNEIIRAGQSDDSDDADFLIRKDAQNDQIKPITTKDKVEAIKDDDDHDIKELKTLWMDPNKLSEEDKFLRDYILNKRYIINNQDGGYFSKDIDKLSDIEDNDDAKEKKKSKMIKAKYHSEESNFDKIVRIPRNSTQTIRDLNEKRLKKEKRLKRIEKRKKLKKKLDEEQEEDEFRYREGKSNEKELKKIMEELNKELSCPADQQEGDNYEDKDTNQERKKKKKKKRGGRKKPMVGVAPDRLLSYGLSKTKLKKSKLL